MCKDCYSPAETRLDLGPGWMCKRCGSSRTIFDEPRELKSVPEKPENTYAGYTMKDYASYFPFPDIGIEVLRKNIHIFSKDIGKRLSDIKCSCSNFYPEWTAQPHSMSTGISIDYYTCDCVIEGDRQSVWCCLSCLHEIMKREGIKTGHWKTKKKEKDEHWFVYGKEFPEPPKEQTKPSPGKPQFEIPKITKPDIDAAVKAINDIQQLKKQEQLEKIKKQDEFNKMIVLINEQLKIKPGVLDKLLEPKPEWDDKSNYWK